MTTSTTLTPSGYRFERVTGPSMTVRCLGCGEAAYSNDARGLYADLSGRAFVAYYCAPCKSERAAPVAQSDASEAVGRAERSGATQTSPEGDAGHHGARTPQERDAETTAENEGAAPVKTCPHGN